MVKKTPFSASDLNVVAAANPTTSSAASPLVSLLMNPADSGNGGGEGDALGVPEVSATVVQHEITKFVQAMHREKREHGDPSLALIERRARKHDRNAVGVSRATLWRAFNGTKLPGWETVEQILSFGFGKSAETINTIWRPWWCAIRNLHDGCNVVDAASTIAMITAELNGKTAAARKIPAVPSGEECELCGAWVVNPQRHNMFHAVFAPAAKTPEPEPERIATVHQLRM